MRILIANDDGIYSPGLRALAEIAAGFGELCVFVPTDDPLGRRVYWLSVRAIEQAEEGTDLRAVKHHYVSLTPLRLDLTDRSALAEARTKWAKETV